MISNILNEKQHDRQLLKSSQGRIKRHNIGNKLSYLDKHTLTMPDGTSKRLSIKDWVELHPEILHDHAFNKRTVFIANAIFEKLRKKLGLPDLQHRKVRNIQNPK